MTVYWVDIEDSTGVKQGIGPITNVLSWTHTAQLDRAGTFSFTLPADDPRRVNLRVKRIARCWTYDGGALKHLGAGIINDIRLSLSAEGTPLLTVSGDDLLHELTYRNVGDLALKDDSWFHPADAYILPLDDTAEDKAAISNGNNILDLAIDRLPGDTSTQAAGNSYNRRVIIKSVRQFNEIRWVLNGPAFQPVNSAKYWDIETSSYQALSFSSDTTVVGGLSWQQNGVMAFTPPTTWGIKPGDIAYKICFENQTYGCPADMYDISLRSTQPTEIVLGPIMGYAPPGWNLDTANGYHEVTGFDEYGANVISNASFEAGTGNAFDDWTIEGTDANDTVTETATASDGTRAVKITNTDLYAKPRIQQALTVEPDAAYLFEADSRGDGTYDGYYSFSDDGDPTFGNRILSYQWTGIGGTSYGRHRQIIYTPPGLTTIYLELRGPDYVYAGSVYWDNLSLRQIIGGGDVQLEFANESVLEALIRVTETNGEHFILSPSGRQVLWLRNDVRSTGVRCVGNVDPQAVEDEPDIALIADMTEQQSAYDLVSRVYPFGGGSGDERATLAACTRGVPAGYTLDATNNCLIRDASETAYGRIDRRLDFPDVVALNQSPAQLQYASNMLFDRSFVYLRRHSATDTTLTTGDVPRAYTITLAKCDRVLLPGYTVRATYEKWFAGARTISIDRDLWILSSTVRVDESGIQTTALECSTTDTRPMNDALLLADLVYKTRAMRAHKPGV